MVKELDPVAKRLSHASGDHSTSLLQWLDNKRARDMLRRRAFWCSLAGWLMVTASAVVGACVAWNFSHNVVGMFEDASIYDRPKTPHLAYAMPTVLILLSIVLVFGGIYLWLAGRFPGFSTTHRALDWASSSEAVSRLLSIGCTYPDAFNTAASVATTDSNRRWLLGAAERVQQGSLVPESSRRSNVDAAVIEMLIETNDAEASQKWEIAAEHFIEVARHRLALLLSAVPVFSTLASGLIIWLSISATLGWMWTTAVRSLNQF